MNLTKLKEEVDRVLTAVIEDGHNPEEIDVAIQIDSFNADSVCTEKGDKIEVSYDNLGCVSGCVLYAFKEES